MNGIIGFIFFVIYFISFCARAASYGERKRKCEQVDIKLKENEIYKG